MGWTPSGVTGHHLAVSTRVAFLRAVNVGRRKVPMATLVEVCETLGYRDVEDVRVGKWITFMVAGEGREDIERRVEEMCNRLLANTVIERFAFELEEERS